MPGPRQSQASLPALAPTQPQSRRVKRPIRRPRSPITCPKAPAYHESRGTWGRPDCLLRWYTGYWTEVDMAEKQTGLRGPDKSQDHLQDARHGTHDPMGNVVAPDTNHQTPHERAQPGADVRGGPVTAGSHARGDEELPEGLKRERKGPLNKSNGRGGKLHMYPRITLAIRQSRKADDSICPKHEGVEQALALIRSGVTP